ncbi:MAG: hypothetical protein ACJ0Q0_04285 [Porticoccaceae bacterium]
MQNKYKTGKIRSDNRAKIIAIAETEFAHADDYEVDDYQRVKATLKSGRSCWVYAAASRKKSKV